MSYMTLFLLFIFFVFFWSITWHRLQWGIFLFFLLLPTYLIRFQIGPLPSTLLEVMLLSIVVIWLIKEKNYKKIIPQIVFLWKEQKLLVVGIFLFVVGATISVFTAVDIKKALGEWRAFYIEPLILFFVLTCIIKNLGTAQKKKFIEHTLLFPLLLCGITTSLVAIYQHFTGWMVPHSFWANRNTYRVTAWYGYPNAVGLFLAQLFCFAWYFLKEKVQYRTKNLFFVLSAIFLIAGTLALIFAKGSGPILGVVAGFGFLFFLLKKTRKFIIGLGVFAIIALFFAPIPSAVQEELLFQNRSGQIRLSMWKEATELIKDNPFSGAGLASYSQKIVPYHTQVNGENIEIFHLPHNIFLSLWVNIGLLGLLGFLCILVWCFIQVYLQTKNNFGLSAFVGSGLITLLVMGIVDTPYIKNDLSILFWVFPLLLLLSLDTKNKSSVY